MRVTIQICLLSLTTSLRLFYKEPRDTTSVHNQLVVLMSYFKSEFYEPENWSYGKNCWLPLSGPSHGFPIDPLDALCKSYKECLKCALKQHGNHCAPGLIYQFEFDDGQVICQDGADTCERLLCRCDAVFAEQTVAMNSNLRFPTCHN